MRDAMLFYGYLRELSEFCCNYNIVIRNRQKYGILVKGDEFHIRDCIIALFMERSDYPFVKGKVGQILDEQQSKQFQELFQGFCIIRLKPVCWSWKRTVMYIWIISVV